jgi:hypothetical protein
MFLGLRSEKRHKTVLIEGGSVNRCFQVGTFSRKVRYGKPGRRRRPISAARRIPVRREKAAGFPLPSFGGSSFLYNT